MSYPTCPQALHGSAHDEPLDPRNGGTKSFRFQVSAATRRRGILRSVMGRPLPMPPPGFDDLPVDEQIEYVQSLWDRIAAAADQVPLHEWQRQVLEERMAAHRAAAADASPWGQVLDRLEHRLRQGK